MTGTSGGDLGGGHDLARLGEAAAAARASVYTIHIDRTFVEAMEASQARIADSVLQDSWLARDGLEAVAGYTGGALIRTVTTADFPLERVALETSAVWLLSFEPLAQDRDGKAHEIQVKVARSDVELRARPQFVVPKTPPMPLAAAVVASPPPPTPAEAAARALEEPASGTMAGIRFAAHVLGGDGAAVEARGGGRAAGRHGRRGGSPRRRRRAAGCAGDARPSRRASRRRRRRVRHGLGGGGSRRLPPAARGRRPVGPACRPPRARSPRGSAPAACCSCPTCSSPSPARAREAGRRSPWARCGAPRCGPTSRFAGPRRW